ncbi:unnamed protein product [Phytomonas sp. EM1]|nr:unnamed protein product [Phytomonas sp. EM1]|eukprot:CCW60894.1 unnamed protein product [Phytomonas sp. isolate EM1]
MSEGGSTQIWLRINKFYQSTRKSVQILVSYTVDAAAASLTFTSLLKASLIPYSIHPVATYQELANIVERTNLAQDFERSDPEDPYVDEFFILIGLGAPVELDKYFDFARHVVVVLDSYRPFNLSNLRKEDETRLMVWGSSQIHAEVDQFFREQQAASAALGRRRQRRRAANQRRRLRKRLMRTEVGDDILGEDGGESTGHRPYSCSQSSSPSTSDEDDMESSDDDESEIDNPALDDDLEEDLADSQTYIDWMEPEKVPPSLEAAYNAAECAGRSCAVEVHELAVLLNRPKDAMLWHTALGVCDLFNRRLIDYGKYLVEMRPLHDAVTLQKSVRNDELADITNEGAQQRQHRSRHISNNTMQLWNREEAQLFLLTHTTLWNAIWYHPVIASVLGLHHVEDGESFVRQLLARCGVSVRRAHQPWRELPTEEKQAALRLVQEEIRHVLERKASFIPFPNQIRCVSRSVGYSTEVSTFDACWLFDSIIAAPLPSSLYEVDATLNAAESQAAVQERLQRFHRTQFWRAYEILDLDPTEKGFQGALVEALRLQQTVANATSALMQPGMLQSTTGIHCMLPNDPVKTTSALESFTTVYRLTALANRLLWTLTSERGLGRYTRAVRPLLLSCAVPRISRGGGGGAPSTGLAALGEGGVDSLGLPASSTSGVGLRAGDGGADAADGDSKYLVLLAHEGARGATMAPVAALGRFYACIHDENEFVELPQQHHIRRSCVVVDGRATAAHIAEWMYLRSLRAGWNP